MLTAIFADIHGNREAFSACLDHARKAGAARIVLLGDYVGYGADPEWCVDRARQLVEAGATAVRGNHDDAIDNDEGGMNAIATAAIDWTRPRLDDGQRAFLAGLPLTAELDGRLFVHANAWAPADWDYVRNEREAERCLRCCGHGAVFVGHVHVPALYALGADRIAQRFEPHAGSAIPLLGSRRWLAVVGAVGQPRGASTAAQYCMFDTARRGLRFEQVPYDAEGAARKVEKAGLPPVLAQRLRGLA